MRHPQQIWFCGKYSRKAVTKCFKIIIFGPEFCIFVSSKDKSCSILGPAWLYYHWLISSQFVKTPEFWLLLHCLNVSFFQHFNSRNDINGFVKDCIISTVYCSLFFFAAYGKWETSSGSHLSSASQRVWRLSYQCWTVSRWYPHRWRRSLRPRSLLWRKWLSWLARVIWSW